LSTISTGGTGAWRGAARGDDDGQVLFFDG